MEYTLTIPQLPPEEFGPNNLRSDWRKRAPIVHKLKTHFSMMLEDLWPYKDRPPWPMERVNFDIIFCIPLTKEGRLHKMDPTNLYGRMKAWEDVLVADGILKEDDFNAIKKVSLTAEGVTHPNGISTIWKISETI